MNLKYSSAMRSGITYVAPKNQDYGEEIIKQCLLPFPS